MPKTYVKSVYKYTSNTILYVIVCMLDSDIDDDDFDPIVKELYIQRIYTNNIVSHINFRGVNFTLENFGKNRLFPESLQINKTDDNIQEVTVPIELLCKDISNWFGDIALLLKFMIEIDDIDKYIEKLNKHIINNTGKKACDRLNLVCAT